MSVSLLAEPASLEIHDVANIFPMMTDEEYQHLVEDIKKHGLKEPIWTYQNKIIDGRNRHKACVDAGVSPRFREWDGNGSLVSFVVSLNLNRRHLNSSQKAIIALEVEKHLAGEAKNRQSESGKVYGRGIGQEKVVQIFEQPMSGRASEQAAKVTNTNRQYVVDAKKIVEQAPELKDVVLSGKMNIPDAKAVAKLPEAQRAIVLDRVSSDSPKKPKAIILDIKKAEVESQAQAAPTKPHITLSSWDAWLPSQPTCDLLITDPPYATDVDDIETFAQGWMPQALAKVKDTGRAYVCVGAYPHELKAYLNVNIPSHLRLLNVLVWTYKNTLGPKPKNAYKQNWQAILYFIGLNAPNIDVPIMNEQFSVQEINAPDGRVGDNYHPWQKPDELAERLIRHSTKPGDVVLDCFSGTGTFLLAAHKLGRIASGCDRSPEMVQLAERRGCEVVHA